MSDIEKRSSGGLRVVDNLVLIAVGVVGVIVAFWVLAGIAGFVWEIIKLGVLIAVVVGVLWMLMGRRRTT